jgi:hypothetical protein
MHSRWLTFIFAARSTRAGTMLLSLVGLAITSTGCCKIIHLGWSSGWVKGAPFVGRVRATPELVARASREDGSLDPDVCRAACEILDPPGELRSCRYRRGRPPALRPYAQVITCTCKNGQRRGTIPPGVELGRFPEHVPLDRALCRTACDPRSCGVPDPQCYLRTIAQVPAPQPGEEGIECVYWVPGHCGNPRLS